MSASEFLETYELADSADREFLDVVITGYEQAMGEMNSYLTTRRKEQSIYCPPADLGLVAPQLVDMLQRSVESMPIRGGFNLGLALRETLIDVFPCP